MKNKKTLPIYAFIDAQNLNLGIKNSFKKKFGNRLVSYQGWKLNFLKFNQYLKTKYKVSKSYLFIGFIPENQKLYDSLKSYGYTLIFKPIVIQDGKIKGNVDAELVLHTMINFKKFSKAVIVAGDGDYLCLIEYLIKKNKLLKILIPNRLSFSSLLRKFHHLSNFITDLKNTLEYKKREGVAVGINP